MGRVANTPLVPVQIDINAPAADSGCGNFRVPSSPLDEQNTAPARPLGPAGGLLIARAGNKPVSTTTTKVVKPKKPPQTTPSTATVKVATSSEVDINIKVQVLADGSSNSIDAKTAKTAKTSINSGVTWKAPTYKWNYQGGKKIITSVSSKFIFKGTLTIQTVYGSQAKNTDPSLYGRGTTNADKKKGNVSLGFHENCHQKDFLNYLKNNPLPVFTGKLGMLLSDYKKSISQFKTAFDKYMKDLNGESKKLTDEVGYTLSKCKKDKKC